MKHFFDIKQLNADGILQLIEQATLFSQQPCHHQLSDLRVANLFFEPSTRTSLSFQVAAQRLAIPCLVPNMRSSSLVKGETLLDTVQTIAAMGVNVFVIRHGDNGIMRWLVDSLPAGCRLVSAGEGWLQHPTQALLDLMTIQQHFSDWQRLSIVIIGDLRHSRVARSLIDGLRIMGVKDIRLVAPSVLQPEDDILDDLQLTDQLDCGIEGADVLVCLRLQKERMNQGQLINETDFYQHYGVTAKRLKLAKSSAIVLHPGPINRNIEISSEVADGPQSVILQQVANGVVMRMAVLNQLAAA